MLSGYIYKMETILKRRQYHLKADRRGQHMMMMTSNGILFFLLLCVSGISAEEAFCGNKCYGQGVVTSRSCHCDLACSTIYKDCCVDSKYFTANGNFTAISHTVLCKRNILSVNSCLKEWNGPEFIINSCKLTSNYEGDPVGSLPVTSDVTGVTYSNYYCAICNGDAENLIMWNIKMSCPPLNGDLPTDQDEAFKYIFYNRPTNEWGYVLRDNVTKKNSFHGCAVTSEIPKPYESKVRLCDDEEIKSCADNWKKDTIREMCDSYSDPVFSNDKQYKNFYCAICNRVEQSNLSCGEAIGPRNNGISDTGNNKMSFTLLLDINWLDTNSVGKRLSALNCKVGEIFDPFARRCRNIVCGIPGYILQNGLCVPASILTS